MCLNLTTPHTKSRSSFSESRKISPEIAVRKYPICRFVRGSHPFTYIIFLHLMPQKFAEWHSSVIAPLVLLFAEMALQRGQALLSLLTLWAVHCIAPVTARDAVRHSAFKVSASPYACNTCHTDVPYHHYMCTFLVHGKISVRYCICTSHAHSVHVCTAPS